jgi:hypothetical protein
MEPSGTPPPSLPPSIPPAAPSPPPRGWWGRNWKWFVPTGCLTLIALFFAFIAVIAMFAFGVIKSSDPYKMALARAKADPRVTQAIGTPIKEAWYVAGSGEVTGGSGKSDLTIPIRGPRGNATIYAVGTKFAGEWRYSKLVVKIESSGETIDLMETADQE